jgi:hypothetical protein
MKSRESIVKQSLAVNAEPHRKNEMRKLIAILIMFFSVTASAQWQPSGATSGPITYNGGNVGINAASPAERLHVDGNLKLTGALKHGKHLVSSEWWNATDESTGYLKLVTPIVHNEGNMFLIHIQGYHYEGATKAVDILCGGYAYTTSGLIYQGCDVSGTNLPVEIGTETRAGSTVVVIRIGTPTTTDWYYSHWKYDYSGDLEKNTSGFSWVKNETTPAQTGNMNALPFNPYAGTLTLGAPLSSGTRLTNAGTSHLMGHVGIGMAPTTLHALSVQGPIDQWNFPGTPTSMALTSNTTYTLANAGPGIAFNAVFNSSNATTTIAAISAIRENAAQDYYAGALTFGTRAQGSGAESMERMRIRSTGEVVIGPAGNTTGQKLTVNGNVTVTGTITGAKVFNAVYQDIAEWVPATEDMAPGTVVVLNPKNVNEVMPSGHPYDTSVAGVVSEQPGVLLGVGSASKEQVATTGRVKVRVDATAAPIRIGDLLVTSGASGAAMRSIPVALGDTQIHRPGTIIGKALEPLDSGTGEILVLLSLQ